MKYLIDTNVLSEVRKGARAGDPLPLADSLLAATAKVHGLTLVTRNTPDIARTGAATLNPWQA